MQEQEKKRSNEMDNEDKSKFNYNWIYAILGVLILGVFIFSTFINSNSKEITYDQFFKMVLPTNDVDKINVVNKSYVEVFIKKEMKSKDLYKKTFKLTNTNMGMGEKADFAFAILSVDQFNEDFKAMKIAHPELTVETAMPEVRGNMLKDIIMFLLPIAVIIGIWMFMMRRMSGGMGGAGSQIFNIGKSKATLVDKGQQVTTTFDDVAGLDEAKGEIMEIVDFLKNPKKYTRLGGKIPKGALLIGPPGTGKTLIAKAMAGEAQVPFFSISGSDFVEMFVGVGASRVRDLFKQAREKAPCIIFIDEIDAIGRARGKNMVQSNDERESTLNQLLVEMDGFGGEKGLIMLAATNRPDVLDSALLRPGRFDRQISIDRPDLKGREQIFNVHLKPIKISKEVDASKLAAQTPGFVGADIANICNEAALIAARKNRDEVMMDDFNDAIDRVIGGLEKKNKIILPEEKEIIAYHEAGHAVCGWFLEGAHPLVKVTIVPRGVAALGYAQYLPKEKYIKREGEILDDICMTLGGRAAESVIYGEISTGAQSDLDYVTKSAYNMVMVYGLSEKVGNVSYYDMMNQNTFHKPFAEDTQRIIDSEVKSIIDIQYLRAKNLLIEKRVELEKLAHALLEKEVLFKDDLEAIIGPRNFDKNKKDQDLA
ncbi:MAG: ATP-dependent zinc metalloprotease FtsH [Bacteroidota bacterium]